jgi:hypothetical protein
LSIKAWFALSGNAVRAIRENAADNLERLAEFGAMREGTELLPKWRQKILSGVGARQQTGKDGRIFWPLTKGTTTEGNDAREIFARDPDIEKTFAILLANVIRRLMFF